MNERPTDDFKFAPRFDVSAYRAHLAVPMLNSFLDLAGLGDARPDEDIEAVHQVSDDPGKNGRQCWIGRNARSSQPHTRLPIPFSDQKLVSTP